MTTEDPLDVVGQCPAVGTAEPASGPAMSSDDGSADGVAVLGGAKNPGARMRAAAHEVALDDATLLARLRDGDEVLFRRVVLELTPVLMRLARGYTPTPAAAQDAVQDTWVTVVDRLDSFQGRSTFKTWVCGILVHTARRAGVRDSRVLPFSSVWRDEHAPAVDPDRFFSPGGTGAAGTWRSPPVRWEQAPETALAAKELRGVIDSAIAELPRRQQEVIVVRDVLGMDSTEAAAILGVSAGNQRVLLHRARSKVRTALETYAGDALAEQPQP